MPTNSVNCPAIILVRPQMGENIGAAARVMLNFGLTDLRIINPRDGWPNPKAEDMSAGAIEVIQNAKVFDTTAEALSDITHMYATTARSRDMIKPVFTPRSVAEEISALPHQHKAAILFGPERSGLENDDITLANGIVTIPVAPMYTSLNLAQAVAVLCYEYTVASGVGEVERPKSHSEQPPIASRHEVEDTLQHLETSLEKTDFFRVPEKKPRMIRNIRNMLTRSDITEQEIRTFRGIIKAFSEKITPE